MSGHSKWANIKHKKAKEDAARGKAFTKLIKEISVASRQGGAIDVNPRLRTLVEKAKKINMPQNNITRAIKRGTGELPGVTYEHGIYEGYAPYGIAIIVEVLTDNKNRTVAALRNFFSKKGGTLNESGSVGWMFKRMGVIRFVEKKFNEDMLLEKLIDFNIETIDCQNTICTITCDPSHLDLIKKEFYDDSIEHAEIEWVAKDLITLSEQQAEKVYEFLEALDELDDTQNVYSNVA